jgi:hypothetical protein
LRAETSSRCVLLRHEGGKTTLVDAARPGPHFKATVRSLLRHMKAKVRASGKRKRVALYLRDRDEAGLRVVMSPLGLGRACPASRLHLIRFHGVLAPNAKLRPEIIPSSGRQSRFSRGGDLPVPGFPSAPVNTPSAAEVHADAPHPSTPARLGWARLLKRVFDIDIEQCPQCGGTLTILAAIEDPSVIAKILTHLGLPARAPPRSPARSFDRLQRA